MHEIITFASCLRKLSNFMSHILSLTGGKCIVICMQFSESDIEMNINDPTWWCWHIMWKPDILYFQSSPVQLQCNRFLSGALIWASFCTKDCTYNKVSTFSLCFRLFKHILFLGCDQILPTNKIFFLQLPHFPSANHAEVNGQEIQILATTWVSSPSHLREPLCAAENNQSWKISVSKRRRASGTSPPSGWRP